MRKKKPIPAVIDQVRITRDGNDAIIEYADATIPETRLTIGPQIKTMTDRDIGGVFNGVMAAQQRLLEDWDRTVTEIAPGNPQIDGDSAHDDGTPGVEAADYQIEPHLHDRWRRRNRIGPCAETRSP
jgi:hypothetical protein